MASKMNRISFSILSPEIIKSIATVRIVTSDLYDVDGYPVEGGVMDPRLGVVDPGLHCRTCGGGIGDCTGHFGYLELAKPVINILFTKAVYKLLKISCKKCGRVMAKEGEKTTREISRNPPAKCPYCGEDQNKIKFLKPSTFYEDKEEMSAEQIREWFERIPPEDILKAGFKGGRPEWLILTLFPVSPVTTRPSITLETGEKSEDDLTHKLVDIVRINQSLRENIDIGAPDFIIKDLWELLQYHVTTYFDNELTGIPQARHRSGRPLKGMIQRMKGKEGRIRGNLLGKRVNFSARTVISPDPRISINEVGVPKVIAEELTIETPVTKLNVKDIKKKILEGTVNYVKRPDGRRVKLSPDNIKEVAENIAPEWVVDRQLEDGDIVLFNRQPSLHRPSIMAHRVKVMPYKTFRISPQVCPPYNADFDGDEMNLHALQTEEARVEASELIDVKNNIISPRFGGPLIGLDLDQISGMYLLTRGTATFSKRTILRLFGKAGIRIELPDKEEFSGKEIFSLLLPKGLNAEFKSSCCEQCSKCIKQDCKHDCWVTIKDGKLLRGTIDGAAIGAMKGKVISRMHGVTENENIKNFIDQAGRLAVAYIGERGFSIGISDLDLDESVMVKVKKRVDEAEKESNVLIEKFGKKEMKILPGLTAEQSLETQILNTLSEGLNDVSGIVKEHIKPSDVLIMANSGAKGSLINITQMAACVGQEAILGQRIKRGYFNRTLTHFKKGDLSADGHGFVRRGFKQELSPTELFWNIMNGREGLMDKSLRTRKSGYMQRRLVNALQDLRISQTLAVRNSNGQIIQFLAGEDGIDPMKAQWGAGDEKARLYSPEETIGVIAAQSLSEPATQMTMRTYHFAGTAGIQVTLGLPRIIEIFDARKELETPTMTINLLPEFQTMEKAKKVAENIKEVKLRDLVVSDILDLTNLEIICNLDPKMMKELGVDMEELKKNIKLKKVKVESTGNELKVTSTSVDVRNLHKLKYKLLELHIMGIKDVTQAIVNKENDEWVITTLGSSLKKVMKIPGVDQTRTTCNNIFEVMEVLGVEAARNAIINQAKFTLDEQGLGVDTRYIMLLADLMTFTGEIQAIGRYGIAGQKDSVLARAAFEETKKHLISASIRNDSDDLTGIVENIMINHVIPAGTGAFGLIGSIPEKPVTVAVAEDEDEKPAKKHEKTHAHAEKAVHHAKAPAKKEKKPKTAAKKAAPKAKPQKKKAAPVKKAAKEKSKSAKAKKKGKK